MSFNKMHSKTKTHNVTISYSKFSILYSVFRLLIHKAITFFIDEFCKISYFSVNTYISEHIKMYRKPYLKPKSLI
jgi:hypothetical protein